MTEAEPTSAAYARLRAAEHSLRRAGCHVYQERLKGFIWLFELGGPAASREDDTVHCTRLERLAGHHGLKSLLSGCIRFQINPWPELIVGDVRTVNVDRSFRKNVQSLVCSKRKREVFGNAEIEEDNFISLPPSVPSDRAQQISRLQNTLNPLSIKSKATVAVNKSLLYFLARHGLGVPLLENAIADTEPANFMREEDAASPYPYGLFCLETAWLPTGSLLTWARPTHIALFSELRMQDRASPVRLLPFKWFGEILNKEEGDKGRDMGPFYSEESSERFKIVPKQDSVALLNQNGLDTSESDKWNRILLYSHRASEVKCVMQWPDRFCISRMAWHPQPGHDLPKSVDPLGQAESWYVNRDARKAQIEAQKHEHRQKSASKSSGLAENKDASLEVGAQRSLHELQNAAGIYPTPPDGNKFQPSGQSAEALGSKTHIQGDETSPDSLLFNESKSDFNAEDESARLADYDHLQDEELLGEMGRHMESDNRITEDDFDFFDEPDDATAPTSQQRAISKGQEDRPVEPLIKAEGTSISKLPEVPESQGESGHAHHAESETSSKNSRHTPLKPVENVKRTALASNAETEREESEASSPQDPSFIPSTKSKPTPEPLDRKYDSSGKFSSDIPEDHPLGSGPSTLLIATNAIPKLGNLAAARHAEGELRILGPMSSA